MQALDQELRRRDGQAAQSIAQLQASQGQLQAESYAQQQQLLAAKKVCAMSHGLDMPQASIFCRQTASALDHELHIGLRVPASADPALVS